MTIHYMIDTETLGTQSTSVILSIGAVCFDPTTGYIGSEFYQNIEPTSCQKAGLTIDASTVTWWMDQSEEARKALTSDRVSLDAALLGLSQFLNSDSDLRIWAHSPMFDVVILEHACRAVGQKQPWGYRDPRDTRTIFDLAGVNLADFASGTYHNALDDARNQAKAVCEAYRRLGLAK
jgi:hypothetical protein